MAPTREAVFICFSLSIVSRYLADHCFRRSRIGAPRRFSSQQPIVAGKLRQVFLWPRAECEITSAAASAPSEALLAWRRLLCSREKTRREQIAGARGVDDFVDRDAGAAMTLEPSATTTPCSERVTTPSSFFSPGEPSTPCRNRRSGRVRAIRFIGEEDIHHAIANQSEKLVAIAVDAKGVGRLSATLRSCARLTFAA